MSPRTRIIGLLATAAVAGVVVFAVVPALGASPRVRLKSENVKSLGGSVLADSHARTLYRLEPETSRHLLCTSGSCLGLWPPVTVTSKSARVKLPSGVHGKVGYLKRGKRFQVTLKGIPLYRYSGDTGARQGNGQDIRSFGGVWKSIAVSKSAAAPAPAPSPSPGY